MKILRNLAELRQYRKTLAPDTKLGFVPTMGALHAGHLSLIEKARLENQVVMASIFVNPLQFDKAEDLAKYPQMLEADIALLEKEGCQALFAPDKAEIYPNIVHTQVHFPALENAMEGKFRKGHFSGVALIVSKLFHWVMPTKAYFGQKDLQQFVIISRLVEDLSFPVALECCPTVREEDGLAMSSRNLRLDEESRMLAPKIYEALVLGAKMLKTEKKVQKAIEVVQEYLQKYKRFQVEYVELVSLQDLAPVQKWDESHSQKAAICVAVHLGGIRLIDNLIV
ncbi:pantoate--beta-alanine ligase [Hugenholtzia roseola]|uniref:pantoate--beta-alanine ligase n=1 Tax=Hugenholtzia roseola TaxID=1002 RepID=UPI0003FB5DBC|nr:pantoate--beta-alanine ligase [Hugenholtzia roseola]